MPDLPDPKGPPAFSCSEEGHTGREAADPSGEQSAFLVLGVECFLLFVSLRPVQRKNGF